MDDQHFRKFAFFRMFQLRKRMRRTVSIKKVMKSYYMFGKNGCIGLTRPS